MIPRWQDLIVPVALNLISAISTSICISVYLGTIYLGGGRLNVFEVINNLLLLLFKVGGLPAYLAYVTVLLLIENPNARLVAICAMVGEVYAIMSAVMLVIQLSRRYSPLVEDQWRRPRPMVYLLAATILLLSLALLLYAVENANHFSAVSGEMYGQILSSTVISFAITFAATSLIGLFLVRCVVNVARRMRSHR